MKRSHYLLAVIIFTLYMLCLSAMAMAGELGVTEVTPFNAFITNTVQPLVHALLALVLTFVTAYLAGFAKKKWGIDISNATSQRINGIALDAVRVIEERAAQEVKDGGEKWLSTEKHSAGINLILSKVPSLSQAQADDLVQSAVAKVKGLGATAELGS